MKIDSVAIIGVGLIGGSIAKALKRRNLIKNIIAIDQNLSGLKESGLFSKVSYLINEETIPGNSLIIIASTLTPYKTISQTLNNYIKPSNIIIDTASVKYFTKENVLDLIQYKQNFVPCHPIAGSEKSGFSSANEDLFCGRRVIITPFPVTAQSNIDIVQDFWRNIECSIEIMGTKEHDIIYANVSHVVHLLSFAYSYIVNKLYPQYIDSGSKDFATFLRLSGSNRDMWNEIFNENALNLDKFLTQYINCLERFKEEIAKKENINENIECSLTKEIPFILASTLIKLTPEEYLTYAGSGFRDFTKICASKIEINNSSFLCFILDEIITLLKTKGLKW